MLNSLEIWTNKIDMCSVELKAGPIELQEQEAQIPGLPLSAPVENLSVQSWLKIGGNTA